DVATRAGLRLGQLRALEGLACASAAADPRMAVRLAAACESLRARTGARALPRQQRLLLHYLRRGLGRPLSGGVLSAQAAARSWTWTEAAHLVRELSEPETDEQPASEHILTPREWDVTGLVTQGLTNQQIAGRLSISVGTVR